MFGYIRTDPAYLYGKDDILYRAFYCGFCKSIGKSCGQRALRPLVAVIFHFSKNNP